jgi:hypothetical protein
MDEDSTILDFFVELMFVLTKLYSRIYPRHTEVMGS